MNVYSKVLCFLIITVLLISLFVKQEDQPTIKGIVYFDIDDTLTTMETDDREKIIQHCIDKGYEVGIITASDRTIDSLRFVEIFTDVSKRWLPKTLYSYMKTNDFETYNSYSITGGTRMEFPSFGNDIYTVGRKKGWQMTMGSGILGVMPSKTFLFDDNKDVIDGARQMNPYGKFIHVNNNVDSSTLSLEMITDIIK
jgi:hypothetical protein